LHSRTCRPEATPGRTARYLRSWANARIHAREEKLCALREIQEDNSCEFKLAHYPKIPFTSLVTDSPLRLGPPQHCKRNGLHTNAYCSKHFSNQNGAETPESRQEHSGWTPIGPAKLEIVWDSKLPLSIESPCFLSHWINPPGQHLGEVESLPFACSTRNHHARQHLDSNKFHSDVGKRNGPSSGSRPCRIENSTPEGCTAERDTDTLVSNAPVY
jgi:hypothetical protein